MICTVFKPECFFYWLLCVMYLCDTLMTVLDEPDLYMLESMLCIAKRGSYHEPHGLKPININHIWLQYSHGYNLWLQYYLVFVFEPL
jgi:hypothetical protein